MAETPPGPGLIRVTPTREQAGQRIDRLLAEAIGTLSRSRVKALIDEGALSRTDDGNGRRAAGAGGGSGSGIDRHDGTRTGDDRVPEATNRRQRDHGARGASANEASSNAATRRDAWACSNGNEAATIPVVVTEPAEPARAGSTYTLIVPTPVAAAPQPQAIPFPILYEDRDLIVLDKPAGLVVHPAPGNWDGTLVNALLAHCGPGVGGFTGIGAEKRPGIVHRLDKDTSGVMVVAKTQLANDVLSAAFAARDLERTYLALCWGVPTPIQGEIEAAIGRDRRDRKRMAVVSHGGKAALTRYRVIRGFATAAALVECRLATGRTHQIRVHMSFRGHPMIGDPVYSRRIPPFAKALPDAARGALLDFPRQALHAASLGFAHPRTGVPLRFATPPPADMAAVLALLDANCGLLTG